MTDHLTVRDLTTQLEQSDGHSVPTFFKGKFEEERFKDLEAIRLLNKQDLAGGKTNVTLDCQHGFYYKDQISITATRGAWDEFWGGKVLYSDDLDLQTLSHSDPSDKVPAVRQPVDARKLTDALEAGNGKALEAALAGKYQEERASILEQVGALNQADLAAHKSDVTLQISVAGSKHAAGGMSVGRERAGFHDSFMGGVQIYSEVLDPLTGKREVSATIDARK